MPDSCYGCGAGGPLTALTIKASGNVRHYCKRCAEEVEAMGWAIKVIGGVK